VAPLPGVHRREQPARRLHDCYGRSQCSCLLCHGGAIRADALCVLQTGRASIALTAELLDLLAQRAARQALGAERLASRRRCEHCGERLKVSRLGRRKRFCGDTCKHRAASARRVERMRSVIREVMDAESNAQFAQDFHRITAAAGVPRPAGRGNWVTAPGAAAPLPRPWTPPPVALPIEWQSVLDEWDSDAG
jgi:hypothetical protein